MKKTLLFLFICSLSAVGFSQSKGSIDLTGTWQTIQDKDTVRMIFNGPSFRFSHRPENILDKMDFLYELKKENEKYLFSYHVAEVTTTYNAHIWVINNDKIKMQVFENVAGDGTRQQLGDSAENSGILVRIKK